MGMENTKIYSLGNSVVNQANNYLFQENITKTDFANRVGIDRSALTKYLNGKYNSDTSTIETTITDYLTQVGFITSTESTPIKPKPKFFESVDSSDIIAVCVSCHENTGLGIVVGKSGFGKTYALTQYAKTEKVCYLSGEDSMGCKDFLEALEEAIGLLKGYGSIWKRVKVIKEFFSTNSGYLIIVDEADKLMSNFTQKKMEILRSIFDQGNVGIVIAGEIALDSMLKRYLPRFANRIDFYSRLEGLTREEVVEYLSSYDLTQDALNEMIQRATNKQTGCFRLLDRTLKNVLRVTKPGEKITLDKIQKASKMMML